jgi:putative PIN family toxin of toxin-antitoxin system
MLPDKIIFDTNIYISLAINRNTKFIVDLYEKSNSQLIICDELIAELTETISRPKFSKYNIDIENYVALITLFSQSFKIKKHVAHLPDHDDNFLVNLALSSDTSLIVTGDKILLRLEEHLGVKFLSLSQFHKKLSEL